MSLLQELLAGSQDNPAAKLREAAAELQTELDAGPSGYMPQGPELMATVRLPYDFSNGYRWITLGAGRLGEAQVLLWQRTCPTNYSETRAISTLATVALLDESDVQTALRTYVSVLHAWGVVATP